MATRRTDEPRGEALMLALQRGEPGALEALIRRYERPVLHVLTRCTRRRAVAEELAQETFLRVFLARGRYRPVARFETWLYRIAWNLASNHARAAKEHVRSIEEVGARGGEGGREGLAIEGRESSPPESVETAERRARVREAIEALPESQRMAVVLHRFEGLSYREIGEVMGLKVPAVKSLLHRARLRLEETLAPYVRMEVRG